MPKRQKRSPRRRRAEPDPATREAKAEAARARLRDHARAVSEATWGPMVRQRAEDRDQEALARTRIGATATERLEWLLAFIRKDLSALRPEERAALGYDLRIFEPTPPPDGSLAFKGRLHLGPMSDETLGALHEQIREGLRRLTEDGGGWRIPTALTHETLMRASPAFHPSPAGPKPVKPVRFALEPEFSTDDEVPYILQGVKAVVLAAGDRLNACRQCGWPFLALHKKQFCSPPCVERWHHPRKKTGGK